ncbi:Crp/Fnr family transcriptional regulator [Lentilactobacillus buchneri]|uniref:Arginine deiminase pathway regulator n=2 Tax=Lentilactobacillus buchneri TaxID=1581 RepID=J9W3K7_LENBU|nr:Crp/Fnr family transcriptional regulator [Lentilactobacillus buchneri]MCC6101362.1 Crp/Fnr family transcriptional regulator [Lactobacillus sp.]WCJ51243.1 Crp/Fnr family transcriptional regulator [Lentilactobacillus sp. Egmn17]AEB72737.1 transcriptional regulator, Crp/Fnr family [Lentilactobacillus buchneri NRRL B-30929]AFR99604.1 arginine deiminase pathway regulator [Lentilactobacillus buchneri subsp. silagei CD034]KRK69088.1 Crp Fnr family transcriptional regulator [Lentilactobacillus buch
MILKNKSDYEYYAKKLRRHPEFSPLSDKYINQLIDEMTVKTYHRGQILFDQGDTRDRFYYLIDGVCKSFHWDKDGGEQLYLYIRPEKAFPYIGLFEDDRYAYTVQTMSEVKLAEFPMPIYEEILRENPELMVNAVKEMSQIINTSETQLQRMVTTSAKCRVWNAILFIGQQIGDYQEDETILVPYPITLVELSKVSGTTRETTSQMVQQLVAENKVQYNRKYFKILEIDDDSY